MSSSLRSRAVTVVVLAAVAVAAAAVWTARAAASSPAQGAFAGFTSQTGKWPQVRFRLSGSSLRDYTVYWRATCRSGKSLLYGTGLVGLRVVAGAWKGPTGMYVGRLPRRAYPEKGTVIGHFRVLVETGRFTSPISATGVQRVTGTLYQNGRQIDSCATGTVSWTAGNTSATGSSSPLIAPATAVIGGLTYAQWETMDWQWAIANLHSHHSKAPAMSACVTTGQQGPVWFLDTDRYDLGSRANATETCEIPAGQYVFLNSPSIECSTAEPPPSHATTDAGLLRCAHNNAMANSLLFNGQLLSPSGFPTATDVFPFTMPPSRNLLEVPGVTSGKSAAYGRPIILGPLPAGTDTIIGALEYNGGLATVLTLRLTVS